MTSHRDLRLMETAGDGGLNPVRTQVKAEAMDEPGVVDFADRVFIRACGACSALRRPCSGWVRASFFIVPGRKPRNDSHY